VNGVANGSSCPGSESVLQMFHRVQNIFSQKIKILSRRTTFVTILLLVGFEALTEVVKKSTIFWYITPCNPLKVNRRFGRKYRLSP
jgi:hypothetical protein